MEAWRGAAPPCPHLRTLQPSTHSDKRLCFSSVGGDPSPLRCDRGLRESAQPPPAGRSVTEGGSFHDHQTWFTRGGGKGEAAGLNHTVFIENIAPAALPLHSRNPTCMARVNRFTPISRLRSQTDLRSPAGLKHTAPEHSEKGSPTMKDG